MKSSKLKANSVKLSLVLFSLAFSLGLCEIGLRVFSRNHLDPQFTAVDETSSVFGIDIICLGNSHTAGVGASPGESYCAQLANIAGENGRTIVTKNWGVPIFNTSDILKDLKDKLKEGAPRLALVMAGEANYFNLRGYSEFKELRSGARWTAKKSGVISFLENHSALYRLYLHIRYAKEVEPKGRPFQLLQSDNAAEVSYRWLSWGRSHFPEGRLSQEQTKEALDAMLWIKREDARNVGAELFRAALLAVELRDSSEALSIYKSIPKKYEACIAFMDSAALRRSQANLEKALVDYIDKVEKTWKGRFTTAELLFIDEIFGKNKNGGARTPMAVSLIDHSRKIQDLLLILNECGSPADAAALFLNAYLFRIGDLERLQLQVKRHFELYPLTPHVDLVQWLQMSENVGPEDASESERVAEVKAAFEKRFGSQLASAVFVPADSVDEWVRVELTEIADLLKSKGVTAVFMTYPPMPFRGLHSKAGVTVGDLPSYHVDKIIREVAGDRQVRLFDTYTVLRERFRDETNLKKFYAFEMGPHDGHLNAAGYRIVAQELFKYLEYEKAL